MISFREYLEQQRSSWRDRIKLHAKHHNGVEAMHTAYPGESLDTVKKLLYSDDDDQASSRTAISRFALSDDKPRKGKASKWEDMSAKVRAAMEAKSKRG